MNFLLAKLHKLISGSSIKIKRWKWDKPIKPEIETSIYWTGHHWLYWIKKSDKEYIDLMVDLLARELDITSKVILLNKTSVKRLKEIKKQQKEFFYEDL